MKICLPLFDGFLILHALLCSFYPSQVPRYDAMTLAQNLVKKGSLLRMESTNLTGKVLVSKSECVSVLYHHIVPSFMDHSIKIINPRNVKGWSERRSLMQKMRRKMDW